MSTTARWHFLSFCEMIIFFEKEPENTSKMRISLRIFFSKRSKTPIIGMFDPYWFKLVKPPDYI